MSLSSSLFSGISGLSTLGNAMQIIGDNIANVNTVGFKSSSFAFQDLLSQSVSTLSGTSQVGRGTALGDIQASFAQGSFESTGNTTDLAVGGDGFFVLNEQGTNNLYYSRAGNFNFNESGYLTNPEGYVVQGWQLDSNGNDVGSITDIVMSSFTSPPQVTGNIEVIVNLDSEGNDNSAGTDGSLASAWDGTNTTPIGETAYEYQTTLRAYDSLGNTHDVTIYFDKADTASAYEFIVTTNPAEDYRTFNNTAETTDITCGTAASLTSGDYFTMSTPAGADFYVWYDKNGDGTTDDPGASGTGISVDISGAITATEVATATAAAITADANFTATSAGAVVTTINAASGAADKIADNNTDFTIATTIRGGLDTAHPLQGLLARGIIDFDSSGSMTDIDMWQVDPTTGGSVAQVQGTDTSNGYFTFSPIFLSGGTAQDIELNLGTRYDGTNWVNSSLSSSQYASASTTTFQSANGYGAGDLEGVNVDVDGVITGSYSNGQLIPLYRVGLAKFQNTQGLFKEGGNLYSETRQSGSAITNRPGTNGLGSIAPNALEQSNVDIANELVKMITTQRGFQANSKIITVTDAMLQELINIKR